jgi:hypothetical protein
LRWVCHKFIRRRDRLQLTSTLTRKGENTFKGLNERIARGCDDNNENHAVLNRKFLQSALDRGSRCNHPNFGNPNNTLTDPFFGRSTKTEASSLGSGGANGGFSPLYQIGGPRSIQLALKLEF